MENQPISFSLALYHSRRGFSSFSTQGRSMNFYLFQSHCYFSLNSLSSGVCKHCKTFLLMRIKQGQDKSCPPAKWLEQIRHVFIVFSLPKAEAEVLVSFPFVSPFFCSYFVWDMFHLMSIVFSYFLGFFC